MTVAATSSQAHVIGLLVAKFQAITFTGLTPAGAVVPVYDGPEGQSEDDNFICVMGWPGDDTAAHLEWAYLGTTARVENYDLAVGIWSYCGGDDNTATNGPEDAQATARANAGAIMAQVEAAMLADRNLSIQNGGTQACVWALVQSASYSETPPEEASSMGRFAQWALKVHVYNVLT